MTRCHRGARRVALFLIVIFLAGCASPADSLLAPAARPPGSPVVVALGDSVPAGTACGCTPFPDLYAQMLSPSAVSLNLAQPGFTTTDVQEQLADGGVRDHLSSATVVLLMAGANDMAEVFGDGDAAYLSTARRIEAVTTDVVGTIRREYSPAVTVVVLGYWNVLKDGAVGLATYGPAGLREAQQATHYVNDALQQAANRSGATYLAVDEAFEGTRRRPQDPTDLLTLDGDHPNTAGHRAIARTIYAAAPGG
ncbi:SGNH/GDSL hydrolase family protein [Actinoplanes sp. NPDC049681]|uniref:SGNH/GDSL hydrolase family protein n=1 Tax=Actinoplanes sp. NPDC049681 TaxID=3363905 RepID=UPI00378B53E7